jgi:hypothetical protein
LGAVGIGVATGASIAGLFIGFVSLIYLFIDDMPAILGQSVANGAPGL